MTTIDQRKLDREPFQAWWALAKGDPEVIDVPVLTEVVPGLWVGGEPAPKLPDGFDAVINLYAPYAQYDPNSAFVRNVPDVDDDEIDDETAELFKELAADVNRRTLQLGETVLVHCQAGLNRSATVVALALMLRGQTADETIRLLRERRHRLVLCNPHFEAWLRSLTPADLDGGPPAQAVG